MWRDAFHGMGTLHQNLPEHDTITSQQVLNAAVNFPIYFLMGTAFRTAFYNMFGCHSRGRGRPAGWVDAGQGSQAPITGDPFWGIADLAAAAARRQSSNWTLFRGVMSKTFQHSWLLVIAILPKNRYTEDIPAVPQMASGWVGALVRLCTLNLMWGAVIRSHKHVNKTATWPDAILGFVFLQFYQRVGMQKLHLGIKIECCIGCRIIAFNLT